MTHEELTEKVNRLERRVKGLEKDVSSLNAEAEIITSVLKGQDKLNRYFLKLTE